MPLFIGTPTLEGFVALVDPARPILAARLVEPGNASPHGMRTDALCVTVQQITPEGNVLYCRIPAARLTRLHGEPTDPDWKEKEAAWRSFWHFAEGYLRNEAGLTLVTATIATPRDLTFLEGTFESVTYDRECGRFVPVGKEKKDEES